MTDSQPREPGSADPAAKRAVQSPWVRLRSRTRHPWIFDKMIAAGSRPLNSGDLVHVYDPDGQPFGVGLFNRGAPIVLRMLAHGDVAADDEIFRSRLRDAISLRRETLGLDVATNAYRLVHAEGDRLSGLIAERYANCVVFEMFSLGMHQRRKALEAWIREILGPAAEYPDAGAARRARAAPGSPPAHSRGADSGDRGVAAKGADWRFFTRVDEHVQELEGIRHTPEAPDTDRPTRAEIVEHGVRYWVDFVGGHKTGFFCDQRDNRRRLAELTRPDASVLDLCCYTGGFSLNAKLRGKAGDVTAVDLDENALILARENANLNQARIQFVHSDAFIYLRQMIELRRQFDVVVLDPPKLVRGRGEWETGMIKYNDLNTLAFQVVKPGGLLLTCSCSGLVAEADFLEALRRAARRANRVGQELGRFGAAADHPVMLECPESAYLKSVWFRVR